MKATLDGTGFGGGGAGGIVYVGSSETVTLKNLLIRNGNAYFGGGIANSGTLNLIGHSQVAGNRRHIWVA